MSLPVTNLDDRKFQDLVDEAKRMIPQLCPEWTNHNLSDPGVALIELFAWMTETTLYRLNQVPDVFYTHMLNLLGFEQFPAAAARADLTFWTTGGRVDPVYIPAGTQVATSGTIGDTHVFTTLSDAVITPPRLMASLTSDGDDRFVDVWDDLSAGLTGVKCFPSEPMVAGDSFYLGFDDSLAGNAIRLNIEATIEGIGVNPGRPPLIWETWQGEGWVAATIPDLPGADHPRTRQVGSIATAASCCCWHPSTSHSRWVGCAHIGCAPGCSRRRLTVPPTGRRRRFAASPPRAWAAPSSPSTVRSWSTTCWERAPAKPTRSFDAAARQCCRAENNETLEVEHSGSVVQWTEVSDFVDSARDDLHFAWDSFTGEIRFGPLIRYPDGSMRQHGAVPREGARIRLNTYRTGGGAAGNVGANTLISLQTALPYISRVQNLTPATGGVDAETVENVKRRGPQSLRAGGRAVTVSDFERLTAQADSRVGACGVWHPCSRVIRSDCWWCP